MRRCSSSRHIMVRPLQLFLPRFCPQNCFHKGSSVAAGGDGTGHDPFRDQSLYESRIPELLLVPWLAYGAGVQQSTRLDEVETMTGGAGRGRYVNIMDTAPTVLHALGVAHPPGYVCRGTAVFEAFRPSASDVRCPPRIHFYVMAVLVVAVRSARHRQS